ncbi:hypothetical protein PIB30_057955 [Stylosanthes scabra]|uniref:Uncharacterized protein n=1 Tax=Stylosanthes scabra TaxID=79078 RepID=A0ABU6ZIJ3_9FABA|nr:hypothetical protein [Stylosanthes scabra]
MKERRSLDKLSNFENRTPYKKLMKSHHYPLNLNLKKTRSTRKIGSRNLSHNTSSNRKLLEPPGGYQEKFITRKLGPKASSSRVGAMLRASLEAQFLRNKAANKWPPSKEESSKIGKIRCNLNRSHKDLNYPQVYKQEASPPQGTYSLTLLTLFDLESRNPISGLLRLFTSTTNPFPAIVLGYAIELVTESTSSYLEYRDLTPHPKSFGQC